MSPVRLALNGASGRMGAALLSLLGNDRRFELVHAVVERGSINDGQPVVVGNATSLRYAHGWAQAPAIEQRISDKVHAPDLVDGRVIPPFLAVSDSRTG